MSSIAGQLILHPKLTQGLAVLATTTGRDKVYRLIQYLARLVAWSLLRRGSIEAADRFDGLKNGLAVGRKIMRIFRPAEFIQSAMRLAERPITHLTGPGQLAHAAQIGRQIGYAGYYGADMLVWLGSIRFLRYDKEKITRLQRLSFRCWLTGIALSLLSTSASLVKLRADGRRFALANQVARREGANEKSTEERAREADERREKGRALLTQRQRLLSQLVMDSCDVWIPATNLGYTNLNDGVVGFLGATTSYMSLQTLWANHGAAGARKSV